MVNGGKIEKFYIGSHHYSQVKRKSKYTRKNIDCIDLKMNNQWSIPIDKLMLWSGNNWATYKTSLGQCTLRLHYDQLLLISETKILESLNVSNKIKGIFKEDVLVLIISMTDQEIRKLRFQIKADVSRCLRTLGERFPVISYDSFHSKNTILSSNYRNIDEIFKYALDSKELGIPVPLPHDYGKFVKLCLLDPTFPQYISETMKILQEDILKK